MRCKQKPVHTESMVRIALGVVSIRILDVVAARIYFRGLRSLCAEAATTSDLRVLRLALQVIGRQKTTVGALLQKIAVHSHGTAEPPVTPGTRGTATPKKSRTQATQSPATRSPGHRSPGPPTAGCRWR